MYSFFVFLSVSYFSIADYELKCQHKKEQCVQRSCKRDENINLEYHNQLSLVLKRRNEVVGQDDSFYRPVAKAPTNVQQDDGCVSKLLFTFATEF